METESIKTNGKIKTASLKLKDGWVGRVALRDPDGVKLSQEQWRKCLSNPSKLTSNPLKVLKTHGSNTVVVKELKIADRVLNVVVKLNNYGDGFRNFFRSIQRGKSVRNFDTTARLCENSIPTAYPLAALEQKNGPLTTRSIFLTEYLRESSHLYDFIRDMPTGENKNDLQLRKQMSSEVASILARLDQAGLWHRDAKGVNFLVQKNSCGEYKILLVDMDGIKHYFFNRRSRRFVAFSKLAATLMCHGSIRRTDYLRAFVSYCRITGIKKNDQRRIYPELVRRAVAIRLLTMAGSMIKRQGIIVEGN